MNSIYHASATRVDLAGGTLDCWPLYPIVGDCCTVNMALDVLTSVHLTPRSDSAVSLVFAELNKRFTFSSWSEFWDQSDSLLSLAQVVSQYVRPASGADLILSSKSPIGAGLGGSSSLCISLLKAFLHWQRGLESLSVPPHDLVQIAHNLEAKVLLTPTGTQDYFPAVIPGLHKISYSPIGARTQVLDVPLEEINQRFFVVYTGRAHHSGINNWQVIKSVVEGDKKVLTALRKIAEVSQRVARAVQGHEWEELFACFREEHLARLQLTPYFTSPEIEDLTQRSLGNGAKAIKICGAGGGGCVLIWSDPGKKQALIEQIRSAGYEVLAARGIHEIK